MFSTETALTDWLPDNGILLHIGPSKTGTTALQQSLRESEPDLEECNIGLHPLNLDRPAAGSIVGHHLTGHAPGDLPDISKWQELRVKAEENSDRKFVISSEMYADAQTDAVERIISDLGPDRVRVLITARPLEKILPSTWQQRIKNNATKPCMEWMESIMEGPWAESKDPRATWFWHFHNYAALAERWAEVAGADNVRVLVVDSRKPDQIFRNVEQILGVPVGTLVLGAHANRSMSAAETEAVRQVNLALNPIISRWRRFRWIAKGAVMDLLENRVPAPGEPRIELPVWATLKAREFGTEILRQLEVSEVQLVGDPGVLVPGTPPKEPQHAQPEEVDVEILVDLIRGMYQAAVEEIDRNSRMAAKETARLEAQLETIRLRTGRNRPRYLAGRLRRRLNNTGSRSK